MHATMTKDSVRQSPPPAMVLEKPASSDESISDGEDVGELPSTPLPKAMEELGHVLPRVLIVSRRHVRKNKFVDFVGEYHLDLIVKYGAVPIIVPRVHGVHNLLDSFEPIHGVLLCEGEDIDPAHYDADLSGLSAEEIEEIQKSHASDTAIDRDKDSIELQLARRCLERSIPYLGICRGSQVLNVACGGSLYQDVERELTKKRNVDLKHMDYDNYDGHRHPIKVVRGTPLHEWFNKRDELMVNSYHHQGTKRLAARFVPMAYAPDGLIEAFYDPTVHNPKEGKFIVGLQFHPERMRREGKGEDPEYQGDLEFDYPECPRAYQEFARAVVAFQKKTKSKAHAESSAKELEARRQDLLESFSIAKTIYEEKHYTTSRTPTKQGSSRLTKTRSQEQLDIGAAFLESNLALNTHQVRRLKQMGATVRSGTLFAESVAETLQKTQLEPDTAEKKLQGLEKDELEETIEYYRRMAQLAEEVLQKKRAKNKGLGKS